MNTGLISLSPGLYSFIPSIGEYNLVSNYPPHPFNRFLKYITIIFIDDIELKFLYDCDHNEIKITEVYDST